MRRAGKWVLLFVFYYPWIQANSKTPIRADLLDQKPESLLSLDHWTESGNLWVARTYKKKNSLRRLASRKRSRSKSLFTKAKQFATSKDFVQASKLLFSLSRGTSHKKDKSQIEYILGLMLMEMNLYQVSSFVFYDVVNSDLKKRRPSPYLRKSLSKLSILSNILDSDVLLRYTISRIKVKNFPRQSSDLFYYRLGELRLMEKKFIKAVKVFSKIPSTSSIYPKALYKIGLSYAEMNKNRKALAFFKKLYQISHQERSITSPNRVNALLAIARVYYQSKKWENAIEYYRRIPRDTPQWYESVFEQSWAMLRSGKYLRSALSNFHTLHSPYYSEKYSPESLILRSMIYLFICRYKEMEKVLNIFESLYKPMYKKIQRFSESASTKSYLDEVLKGQANYIKGLSQEQNFYKTRLPNRVLNHLVHLPEIEKNLKYMDALLREKKIIKGLPRGWQISGVGRYAHRIVTKRIKSTKKVLARQARKRLREMNTQLRGFFEQGDFLRFEMVGGKKESLKKQIVGKNLKQVTEKENRDFFITNGYEYWPYQGEYWLDEIGNYHYVGMQACD